jgi:hypothetical protein
MADTTTQTTHAHATTHANAINKNTDIASANTQAQTLSNNSALSLIAELKERLNALRRYL